MLLLRGGSAGALIVAMVLGFSAFALAQENEPQDQARGPVVQIGKADDGETKIGDRGEQPAVPKYWIGLAGAAISPDHVLRAHVKIPDGQGLLVAHVVPDSPAEKAGLKQHDILLRANDAELHEMQNLVDIVSTEGEKQGKIEVEILRGGERESVSLTPEERPADAQPQPPGPNDAFGGGFGPVGPEGIPQELLRQFPGRFQLHQFGGPGGAVGNIPSGVSVSISREEGKPAHITVKRGDETWEVVGDDPESLKQLPDDLRPFVERMLHGASPMDLHMEGFGPGVELGGPEIQERIERMEKQMQEMLERMNERHEAPKADESK
jgi:hypothetical protein